MTNMIVLTTTVILVALFALVNFLDEKTREEARLMLAGLPERIAKINKWRNLDRDFKLLFAEAKEKGKKEVVGFDLRLEKLNLRHEELLKN